LASVVVVVTAASSSLLLLLCRLQRFAELTQHMQQCRWTVASSVNSWYDQYVLWAQSPSNTLGTPTTAAEFYTHVNTFLTTSSVGREYAAYIR
jgi:hypothetical protein